VKSAVNHEIRSQSAIRRQSRQSFRNPPSITAINPQSAINHGNQSAIRDQSRQSIRNPPSIAAINPQSAINHEIHNQSAIRNPQSAIHG
jgi:hypothetical protein